MIFIEKEPVIKELNRLYNEINAKAWGKKDKIMMLGNLITMVNGLQEVDPYAEDPENFWSPPAEMVKELEPITPHSIIGKENFYCGNCKTRVKQKDCYCRKCGHRFE